MGGVFFFFSCNSLARFSVFWPSEKLQFFHFFRTEKLLISTIIVFFGRKSEKSAQNVANFLEKIVPKSCNFFKIGPKSCNFRQKSSERIAGKKKKKRCLGATLPPKCRADTAASAYLHPPGCWQSKYCHGGGNARPLGVRVPPGCAGWGALRIPCFPPKCTKVAKLAQNGPRRSKMGLKSYAHHF